MYAASAGSALDLIDIKKLLIHNLGFPSSEMHAAKNFSETAQSVSLLVPSMVQVRLDLISMVMAMIAISQHLMPSL